MKNQAHGSARNGINAYHDRSIASQAPKESGRKLRSKICWSVRDLLTHVADRTNTTVALKES